MRAGACALLGALSVSGPAAAATLTDAQLAGQRVIFAFSGTEPPPELVTHIERGEAAGVILFGSNIPSVASVRRLVTRLQAIPRPANLDEPLLVMVDQEGGLVERIPDAALTSAARLGSLDSVAGTRAAGRRAAADVASIGANVNLAPVADVARRGSAIERETRSFGRNSAAVTRHAVAFAAGIRAGGVLAAAKHFPGFGGAPANTDNASVRIGLPLRTIRTVDEAPFAALIRDKIPLVLIGSSVYTAFDTRPATLSRKVIQDELRGRLGFQGVTVSDALDTPALAAAGAPGSVAREAATAGVDLLLYSGYAGGDAAVRSLTSALRSGRLNRAAAQRTVDRVLGMRSMLP